MTPAAGQSPIDLALWLSQQPEIIALEVRTYLPAHGIRARLAAGEDRTIALMHHDDDPLPPARIGRHRLASSGPGAILRLLTYAPDGAALALSSRIDTVIGPRLLLLLDFACAISPESQAQISRAATAAGWRGAILESGASYHFLGFEPLDQWAWGAEMGRALLLSDLIDVRYQGHALIRGSGALRLTSTPTKPMIPRVVEVLP